jgi:Flp pilus assembly protein TadG
MSSRKRGQSLVEMALLAPLLLALLFGIIDLAYYLWGYATIFNAARNASERAAMLPPYPETLAQAAVDPTLYLNDPCMRTIIEQVRDAAGQFQMQPQNVQIRYLPAPAGVEVRKLGRPIEVVVRHDIQPLTPLVSFFAGALGNGTGVMNVTAISQRSIESLGTNPNPEYEERGGIACKRYPDDF